MIETGRARVLLTREGMIYDGIAARVIQAARGPVRQYAPAQTRPLQSGARFCIRYGRPGCLDDPITATVAKKTGLSLRDLRSKAQSREKEPEVRAALVERI
ncbi:MAG: hypothetical protein WC993_07730 [Methanoculleus sp.]